MGDPYTNYYLEQAGGGFPVFVGARTQRGHGIGSILGGIARTVFPLIAKKVVPIVKKQALKAGVGLATDVLKGRSFSSSAKKRLMQGGIGLMEDVVSPPKRGRKPIKRVAKSKKPIRRRRRAANQSSGDIFD